MRLVIHGLLTVAAYSPALRERQMNHTVVALTGCYAKLGLPMFVRPSPFVSDGAARAVTVRSIRAIAHRTAQPCASWLSQWRWRCPEQRRAHR